MNVVAINGKYTNNKELMIIPDAIDIRIKIT